MTEEDLMVEWVDDVMYAVDVYASLSSHQSTDYKELEKARADVVEMLDEALLLVRQVRHRLEKDNE